MMMLAVNEEIHRMLKVGALKENLTLQQYTTQIFERHLEKDSPDFPSYKERKDALEESSKPYYGICEAPLKSIKGKAPVCFLRSSINPKTKKCFNSVECPHKVKS